jgi:hypothetical protein
MANDLTHPHARANSVDTPLQRRESTARTAHPHTDSLTHPPRYPPLTLHTTLMMMYVYIICGTITQRGTGAVNGLTRTQTLTRFVCLCHVSVSPRRGCRRGCV